MDANFITRAEHDTFAELMKSENTRLKEEDDRQNKRLAALENNTKQITDLTISIKELAVNMQNMAAEQRRQGEQMAKQTEQTDKRLKKLESKDGEKWRKAVGYVCSAAAGILVAYLFSQLGIS